jgi:hypothetical protein
VQNEPDHFGHENTIPSKHNLAFVPAALVVEALLTDRRDSRERVLANVTMVGMSVVIFAPGQPCGCWKTGT